MAKSNLTPVTRKIFINREPVSITLEPDFWKALKPIAKKQNISVVQLLQTANFSHPIVTIHSAVRLFVLDYYRSLRVEKEANAS